MNKTFTEDEFNDALLRFIEGAQAKVDAHWKETFGNLDQDFQDQQHEKLNVNPNSKRYVGIFATRPCDTRFGRIYAFIDTTNGDVLKPATFRAPAKHARGNIFDASNGLASVNHYGPAYLR